MQRVKLKSKTGQTGPHRGDARSSARRIGAGSTMQPKEVSEGFEEQRGRGRPKGSLNKVPLIMKDASLAAAAGVGEDRRGKGGLEGYFRRVAIHEPVAFLAFIKAFIPHQLQHSGLPDPQQHEHHHYHSIDDIRAALKQRGLSVDEIYEKPMKVIEHRKDELKAPKKEMSSVQKAMIGRG